MVVVPLHQEIANEKETRARDQLAEAAIYHQRVAAVAELEYVL